MRCEFDVVDPGAVLAVVSIPILVRQSVRIAACWSRRNSLLLWPLRLRQRPSFVAATAAAAAVATMDRSKNREK
jgi:Tfp pilus assembly protein PilN